MRFFFCGRRRRSRGNRAVTSTCGADGALCAAVRDDERALVCPPAITGCVRGYYAEQTYSSDARSLVLSTLCVPCANAPCTTPGWHNVPCEHLARDRVNPCMPCGSLLGTTLYVQS